MFELWVNGVALERWTVARGFAYRPPVSVRASLVEVPGRHGVTAVGLPVFDEPQVTINLAPSTRHDEASLDVMLADLAATVASPALVLRRTSDGRTEEAPARLVSFTPDTKWIEGRWARAALTLAIPGVFFRDLAPALVDAPAGRSVQAALAGSGPVGDAVVRFPAGASDPQLVDVLSGTGVIWPGTVPASRWLYVDAGSLRAWETSGSGSWAPVGTDRSAGLDFPPAGPLQLWPAPTVEQAKVVGRAVTVEASHAVRIRARRSWL